MDSINKVFQHWTQEKWTPYECEQRMREGDFKGNFYTEGPAGGATTSKFTFLKEEDTGALLQQNSNWETLAKVMAASVALCYPWKVPYLEYSVPGIIIPAVILGNLGIVQAGESVYKNGVKDIRSQLPSTARVWTNLVPILKAGAACIALNMHQGMTSYMLYSYFTTCAVGLSALYVIYNPRGAALWINSAERLVGPTPKPEYHATANKNYDFTAHWQDFIEGRIPLTCIMGMHSPGNISDQLDRDYVFQETNKKSQ